MCVGDNVRGNAKCDYVRIALAA